jgi:hypothetical protein
MASELSLDKTKISGTAKTIVAVITSVFTAGVAYANLHADINELKAKQSTHEVREEKATERDSQNALHLQRVDDALEHLKDSVDRIDKNVQELRRR